jgi:hypothetical protein
MKGTTMKRTCCLAAVLALAACTETTSSTPRVIELDDAIVELSQPAADLVHADVTALDGTPRASLTWHPSQAAGTLEHDAMSEPIALRPARSLADAELAALAAGAVRDDVAYGTRACYYIGTDGGGIECCRGNRGDWSCVPWY